MSRDDLRTDFLVALLQDLLSGAVVMGKRIARIGVLIEDVRIGNLLVQPLRNADICNSINNE